MLFRKIVNKNLLNKSGGTRRKERGQTSKFGVRESPQTSYFFAMAAKIISYGHKINQAPPTHPGRPH